MLNRGATNRRGTIQRANMPARARIGRPRAVAQGLDQAEPDADEQDHAAVDRDDSGQQEEGVTRVALARVAEEPRPRQLGLERRTRQGGTDTHRDDGEEAQKCGLPQEAPVVRGAVVRFDALGEGEPGGDAHAGALDRHRHALEPRVDTSHQLRWRRPRSLFFHWGLCLASSVRRRPYRPIRGYERPGQRELPQLPRNVIVMTSRGARKAT